MNTDYDNDMIMIGRPLSVYAQDAKRPLDRLVMRRARRKMQRLIDKKNREIQDLEIRRAELREKIAYYQGQLDVLREHRDSA